MLVLLLLCAAAESSIKVALEPELEAAMAVAAAVALELELVATMVAVSHVSTGVAAVGVVPFVVMVVGRSSLAGSVQAPRLSLARPNPSREVRERRPESDAKPEVGEREDEVEVEQEEGGHWSRGLWEAGSSKSVISPTAELTSRISPTFFSKTTKRLSCGFSTAVVSDAGRSRMLCRDPRPRPCCCDESRPMPVVSERLRERLSCRHWWTNVRLRVANGV